MASYDSALSTIDHTHDPNALGNELSKRLDIIQVMEFSSERKCMSTIVKGLVPNSNSILLKGAPERVIEKCKTYKNTEGRIQNLSD